MTQVMRKPENLRATLKTWAPQHTSDPADVHILPVWNRPTLHHCGTGLGQKYTCKATTHVISISPELTDWSGVTCRNSRAIYNSAQGNIMISIKFCLRKKK